MKSNQTNHKLTLKQKLFCEAYIKTLGNATEALIKAGYDVMRSDGTLNRSLAKSMASENLTKPNLLAYLNTLLEKAGLNDQMVSSHHAFLINQSADLPVKMRAIDLYYKVNGKYADKVEHGVTDEVRIALDKLAAMLPD